jgi:hypothetical protein
MAGLIISVSPKKKFAGRYCFAPDFPLGVQRAKMRFTGMLLGILGLAGLGMGADSCTVRVGVTNLTAASGAALLQAKSTARELFARIGVDIEWQNGTVRDSGVGCRAPIEIHLRAGLPGADRPGSMAYAMPYMEGAARIEVFVGQISSMVPANRLGILLGHVMTHEIGHVLQGVDRHSGEGVMKARWSTQDFRAMEAHALRFDGLDVLLIHAGIRRPSAGEPLTGSNE